MTVHEYFSSELQYVADAINATEPSWDGIDPEDRATVAALPEDVIEVLGETCNQLMSEPGFRELRNVESQLLESRDSQEREAGEKIKRFQRILRTLGDAEVEAFTRKLPTIEEIVEGSMAHGDWSSVPEDLKYLQGVAERYWRFAIAEFYDGPAEDHLEEHDLQVFRSVAKVINREGHMQRIFDCEREDPKNSAYNKMDCVLQVLDQLGLLE